jgi:hypothetical protein
MEPIRERALGSFSSIYMTMVSLIEAIALELLVGRVLAVTEVSDLGVPTIVAWLEIAFMFEVILGIWIAYAIMSMATRWVMTLYDSAIVFALGMWQFLAISWIDQVPSHYWLWWTGIGGVIAILIIRGIYAAARRNPENDVFVGSFPLALVTGIAGVLTAAIIPVACLVQLELVGEWLVACALVFGVVAYSGYIRAWTRWWRRTAEQSGARA